MSADAYGFGRTAKIIEWATSNLLVHLHLLKLRAKYQC